MLLLRLKSPPVRRLQWTALFSQRECVWQLTQFLLPGKRLSLNRIGHPYWVKLCIELNCVPNQNTFCYRFLSSVRDKPYIHTECKKNKTFSLCFAVLNPCFVISSFHPLFVFYYVCFSSACEMSTLPGVRAATASTPQDD